MLAGGLGDWFTAEWVCAWQLFLSSLHRLSWSGGQGWPTRRKLPVDLEPGFCFVTGVCSTLYLEDLSLNPEHGFG